MAKTTSTRLLDYALLGVSILLVAGSLTFAGPCAHDDGQLSTCFNASAGIIGAGVFLVGMALAELVFTDGRARGIVAVLAALLGLFVMFAPGNLMPLCMMETMQCRAVMQPFAMVCGGLVVVLSAILAVLGFRSR